MKLEQATIHNTKVGDKCYIEYTIQNILKAHNNPFTIVQSDSRIFKLTQEEIPTLGEGVEMEVDSGSLGWVTKKIIARFKDGYYIDSNFTQWDNARPIQLTLEQKYENLLKENEELKQKLSKM